MNAIKHITLGNFPTPIKRLDTLGTLLQTPNLYVKQDNQSGTLFGGNKLRKLEFLLGEALASKAKGVLTWGFACSNHTCATAIYCHQLGLPCIVMHLPQLPTAYGRRNLLLSQHYGAELNYYRGPGERELATFERAKKFKEQTGGELYFIPSGGSNDTGAIGFVNAAFELKEQIAQGLMPEPDYLYAALGSAGTTAGLILGLKAAGLKTKVIPMCIEPDDYTEQHKRELLIIIEETSKRLHKADRRFPLIAMKPEELTIPFDFVGKGYAHISDEAHQAIELLLQTEGIKLDGTYTGKAFAGLLHDLATKDMKDKVVLFWNSFCSTDYNEITSTVDYHQLPAVYHHYFESPLQPNDHA
jgi:1-aminocyclopropane-1-carboxylate deaminase/D-cysteine desulfhydrase-like pyridoxal-dependent ACC family enzyme